MSSSAIAGKNMAGPITVLMDGLMYSTLTGLIRIGARSGLSHIYPGKLPTKHGLLKPEIKAIMHLLPKH